MKTFFGLSSNYEKNVFKQFSYMMYYGNWSSLNELVNLPVGLRDFFFKDLQEIMAREKEANSPKGKGKEANAMVANKSAQGQYYLNKSK